MILEEETYKKFGYYPSKWKPKNSKRIIAACDDCGKVRILRKDKYRSLCNLCARKGRITAEETKVLLSIAMKGKTNALGHKVSEDTKANISKNQPDRRGKKNPNYKGGKKVVQVRIKAKRKRQLGYTLLMPLKKGEDGHHVTDEYVIGIPTKVHHNFNSNSRKKHRTLVLQWLKANDKKKYKMVLCVLAKEPLGGI